MAGLTLAVDGGPFAAPSDASIRALNHAAVSLQSARHLAAEGRLLDAEAAALLPAGDVMQPKFEGQTSRARFIEKATSERLTRPSAFAIFAPSAMTAMASNT